jgi:hypothetical protein
VETYRSQVRSILCLSITQITASADMQEILKYLSFIPEYFRDLIRLVASPKAFSSTISSDSSEDWTKSLAFFAMSASLNFVLLSLKLPNDANYLPLALRAIIGSFIEIALVAAIVRLSWACVGGKADYRATLFLLLYFYSVFRIISSLFQVIMLKVIEIYNNDFYQHIKNMTRERIGSLLLPFFDHQASEMRAPTWALSAFSIIFLIVLVWGIACWGAFRSINHVSKIKSIFAWIICQILMFPTINLLNIVLYVLNPTFWSLR